MGILVVSQAKIKKEGGELRIAGATGVVEEILKMTSVDKLVHVFPTVEAAAVISKHSTLLSAADLSRLRECPARARMLRNESSWIAVPAVLGGSGGLTAYGAVHPRSQLFGPSLCWTDAPRKLAITFDDGPNPAMTPKLLELLERHKVKATFFVIGKFVRECPGLTKEIRSRGHVLGNHTDTHPNLFFCGPPKHSDELTRCGEAILSVTWETPRWFRPPYGYRSPWLGRIVHELDMRMVTWSLLAGRLAWKAAWNG